MKCPKCSKNEDKVIDSRTVQDGESVRRRRVCLACNYRFTTYERVARMTLRVLKRGGISEEFSREKLIYGVGSACKNCNITDDEKDELIELVIQEVFEEFDQEVPSTVIGKKVMERLYRVDQVAFVRFASVYRRYSDVQEYLSEIEGMIDKKK